MKPNGYTIYDGPSLLDGSPIIALITGFAIPTANPKMGPEPLQTWMLRKDQDPVEAVRSGADVSICGDCPHRGWIEPEGNRGRSCYVNYGLGVRNLWLAWQRGNYPKVERPINVASLGFHRVVRIGSYGDPAAVPFTVWRSLVENAMWSMGYTRQWRAGDLRLRSLCMASVISEQERDEARSRGWRTFRMRTEAEPVGEREIVCPASAEAGKKAVCADCRACGGLRARAKVDVTIIAHGPRNRVANFTRSTA